MPSGPSRLPGRAGSPEARLAWAGAVLVALGLHVVLLGGLNSLTKPDRQLVRPSPQSGLFRAIQIRRLTNREMPDATAPSQEPPAAVIGFSAALASEPTMSSSGVALTPLPDESPPARPAGRYGREGDLAPDVLMFQGQAYWPDAALQRLPMPVSSPDFDLMRGLQSSGLPVVVRLFIDKQGVVRQLQALQATELDADMLAGLQKMFEGTRFVPGLRGEEPVASYKDLEFSYTTQLGAP